jgi:hypothetical protein
MGMTIDGDNQADAGQQVSRAESLRAEGRLDEAKELLSAVLSEHPDHTLGRLVLALVHLDLGQQDQSRSVLEAALSTPSILSEPVVEPVLDTADESAVDPLELVQAEMNSGEEAAQAATSTPDLSAQFSADSPFANPTMAKLLEEQGHAKEAEALRSTMGDGAPVPVIIEDTVEDDVLAGVVVGEVASEMACEIGTEGESLAIIATLERWLGNVQRSAV